MYKRYMFCIFTMSIFVFLTACGTERSEEVDISNHAYSSEKIEVYLPGESEPLETITDSHAIRELFDNFEIDTWEVKKVPANSTEGTIYKLYDRETAKFGESIEDKKLYESGLIIVYSNEPFIEFKTNITTLSFKVPIEVQESLLK